MCVCSAVLLKHFLFFLEKELPKSCNYHFIFVRQKLVGALDVSLGALGFGGGYSSFFRHCRPV